MLACVIAGGVLRVWAALDNFWLDEIWSLNLAQSIRHPWEIITLHHDNNHILNTFYLFLVGKQQSWFWYRILSIVTGAASVAIIGYGTLRCGFLEAATATALAALSYPLILYASEARGYAPAVFFSLTSFFLFQNYWQRRNLWKLVLFWTSVALGLLSHFTFIYVYLSLVVWSFVHKGEDRKNRLWAWIELLKCHTIPILCIILLYMAFLRHMTVGGGPEYNAFEVMRRTLLLALGAPEKGFLKILGVATGFAAFLWGIISMQREKSGLWVFYLSVLLLAPAFVLIVDCPKYLYFRYFLVCFPFFYLLLSHILAHSYRQSNLGKILYIVVLLLFGIGNIQKTYGLLTSGRGNYLDAVRYLAENTKGEEICVGSDHDFRNKTVLSFYERFLPSEKRLVYLDKTNWPKNGPHWLIVHSQKIGFVPPTRIKDRQERTYTLVRSFPYSGISGWSWFVYLNDLGDDEKKHQQ